MPAHGKRRSLAQKSAIITAGGKANNLRKETPSTNSEDDSQASSDSSTSLQALREALEGAKSCIQDYKRRLHNSNRKLKRALATSTRTRAQLAQWRHAVATAKREANSNAVRVRKQTKQKISRMRISNAYKISQIIRQSAVESTTTRQMVSNIRAALVCAPEKILITSEQKKPSFRTVKNTLRMRNQRTILKQKKAIKMVKHHWLKKKGVITESTREMVRELVVCGVPVKKLYPAIEAVAQGFGLHIGDSLTKHSVSRIVLEGKIASQIQLVEEIDNSGGNVTSQSI